MRYTFVPGSADTEIADETGRIYDANTGELVPRELDAATLAALFGGERWHRGEANPAARLTDADAAEIRRVYALPHRGAGWLSQTELAEQYGVSQATVSKIVNGKAYINE